MLQMQMWRNIWTLSCTWEPYGSCKVLHPWQSLKLFDQAPVHAAADDARDEEDDNANDEEEEEEDDHGDDDYDYDYDYDCAHDDSMTAKSLGVFKETCATNFTYFFVLQQFCLWIWCFCPHQKQRGFQPRNILQAVIQFFESHIIVAQGFSP